MEESLMEREKAAATVQVADGEGQGTASPEGQMEATPIPPKKRVRRRKKAPFVIGGILLLAIVGGIWWFRSNQPDEVPEEVLNDVVGRGSITSMVEGNGQVKAKSSESISVGTGGTVLDVYVSEGQLVTAGTVLYLISSPSADEAVTTAQKDVEGYQKQLKTFYEDKQNLNVKPEFGGKLLEVEKLQVGDTVDKGRVLARLVDDSKMKLTQYYSYAYEGEIYLGLEAKVSVPGVMQQLTGTVTEVNQVERVSAEGAKLFSVVVTIDNPGTLTEKLPASAVLMGGGEEISPYEQGALEFTRDAKLTAKAGGKVTQTKLQDYLKVNAGQVLVVVDGEDNDNQIFNLEENLRSAQEALETAKKNKANLQATAPIDGTVVGLSIAPGDEVTANHTVISIMDTSQMIVEAAIDERNVSYVKEGMMAEIDQYGTVTTGIVESVGLNGKFENGMSTFPAKIVVDNMDGMLNSNGSVIYRIQASQSEDCLILPSQCVKSVADPETGESIDVVFVKADTAPERSMEIDGTTLGVPKTGYFAVPVEIGIADKFNVEIIAGVEEGTEVFTQVVKQNSFSGGMMYG